MIITKYLLVAIFFAFIHCRFTLFMFTKKRDLNFSN